MENSLLIAFIATLLYVLFRYLDYKYLQKEEYTVRNMIRESICVFGGIVSSIWLYENYGDKLKNEPKVFSGEPDF